MIRVSISCSRVGEWVLNASKREAEAHLPNLTLIDRVPDEKFEEFLSAADIWIIPYRKNVAGVSVPAAFITCWRLGGRS